MSPPEIPIISLGQAYLISLQGDVADEALSSLKDRLVQTLSQNSCEAVIIDVSGLSVMDSFMSRELNDLAQGAQLTGVEVFLVGIQPHIAMTLVQMGLSIPGVQAEHSVEAVLDRLNH